MQERTNDSKSPLSRRLLLLAAVVGTLVIAEAAMLGSARQESQTSDEAYDIFGGYVYLTAGNYSIAFARPPLEKDIAALPLLRQHLIVPRMTKDEVSDFRSGRIFLYSNPAARVLFSARAATTIFPLLLAILVFLAAWEMFGIRPALIALVLIAVEPNFLAHGPIVANDVALAACIFASIYAFWRYVTKPTIARLAVCGIATGLTLAAKHSGIVVFAILFVLALADLLTPSVNAPGHAPSRPPSRGRAAARSALAMIAIAAVSVMVLWCFYGFHYSPIAGTPAPSLAPMLEDLPNRHAAFLLAAFARFHLLPEAFLYGLAFLFATDVRPMYLLGTRYVHGVWYYFPVVMLIKSTLGFLLLMVLTPFAKILRERQRLREVLWMAIPAGIFLAGGITSKLDIGVRHILPVYPFLCILAAAGAASLMNRGRAWTMIIVGLVAVHVASSLSSYPNFLAYSNELWGGPYKTYRVLSDSNVDWGQNLPLASGYLARRPGAPCWMAYFGSVDPAYYGITCQQMPVHESSIWGRPTDVIPPVIQGEVLVSATELSGQLWGPDELNPYEPFRRQTPAENLGGSILVYRGTFNVPLLSALSSLGRIGDLASRHDFDAALEEARAAETLVPQSVDIQFALGRVLRQMGRGAEAQQAFEKALHLAQTIHPEAQSFWIPVIENELKAN
jgi:hypothetical protein